MQRRLMKALEDLSVAYDLSVRAGKEYVVQFAYGDDTLNPIKIDSAKAPIDCQKLLNYVQVIHPLQEQETTLLPFEMLRYITDSDGEITDKQKDNVA